MNKEGTSACRNRNEYLQFLGNPTYLILGNVTGRVPLIVFKVSVLSSVHTLFLVLSWLSFSMKKNERAEFYLLLFRKCTTVVEASFPINLEYPSHSALLFSWEILHNILWSQNSENSLHFVSLSKRLHVVGMGNLQRNVIKQGKLPPKWLYVHKRLLSSQ